MFRSAFGSTQYASEFSYFAPLLTFVARGDRIFDAVRDMVGENFLLRTPECCLNCRNLRDDVDAIAIFFDHPGKAADLAFNPVESLERRRLDLLAHEFYVPLRGIRFKVVGGKLASWHSSRK